MPSQSRIISLWPAALRDQEVANNAAAGAELAQTIAGRARWLYEMATGGPASSTEPAAIARNPQGLVGHDHSGPPYGSAFMHLLYGFSGEATGPGWSRQPNTFVMPTPRRVLDFSSRVWIRPHPPLRDTPYSRGVVQVRGVTTGGSQAVDVLLRANGGPLKTETTTFTTTVTTFTLTAFLDLSPGFNDLSIILDNIGATHPVYITGLAVLQTAKRSH